MNSRTYRIVIIICLILVVVGSIFAVSQLRSGGGGNAKPTPTPTPVTFAGQEDGEFTMTVQGPIVANELFHSSTITVSASNRTFTAYTTYDNVVSANTTFGNNLEAYQQFATAMQNAGYSKVSTERNAKRCREHLSEWTALHLHLYGWRPNYGKFMVIHVQYQDSDNGSSERFTDHSTHESANPEY